jgi:hypothetical protein
MATLASICIFSETGERNFGLTPKPYARYGLFPEYQPLYNEIRNAGVQMKTPQSIETNKESAIKDSMTTVLA